VKTWFENLKPRERLILGIGAGVAAIIVVWGVLWTPLRNYTLELRDEVADKRQLVVDLQRAESLSPDSGSGRGPAEQSLLILIENTARAEGLAGSFTRTRPDGPDAINVSFQDAPFDELEAWLITLESTHGVAVERASFNGSREQGLVTGQLFLRRI
jgi:type II secretory pathway component PulM